MPEDDAGDKTEQPTARRREEAREEGQIARSVDLTAAAALLGAMLLLKALGPRILGSLVGMTRTLGDEPVLRTADLGPWIKQIGLSTAEVLLPFLLAVVAITIAATAAQSGISLTWKKLTFKLDRMDPVRGLKRMFSTDSWSRLALGLFKVGLVGSVAYQAIVGRIGEVLASGSGSAIGILGLAAGLVFDLAVRVGMVLLVLGIVDYILARFRLEKQLRMSKQEVRDEMKRMEGDPLLKQRRRQIQARLAMQRIQSEVPKADVIVTNPTEYAVAMRYDDSQMTAPRVVAKGKDLLALRIRQLAQQHGVPIVARPPLARALYAGVEVGHEVPPAFYRAVAEVLAYVYQLSRKAG